jgi:hypothetical protein
MFCVCVCVNSDNRCVYVTLAIVCVLLVGAVVAVIALAVTRPHTTSDIGSYTGKYPYLITHNNQMIKFTCFSSNKVYEAGYTYIACST